jgi:adhesin YadB/C
VGASTLTSAKSYTDSTDATTLASAKSYTDSTDATTLTSAKSYTDTKAGTLKDASNVQYADATTLANTVGASTLTSAKSYTDTKAGTLKDASNVQYADATSLANAVGATAKSYTDSTDATTLASAKSYTDSTDATTLASAKSYADSTDATTLTSAKSYTDTKAGTLKDASNVQYADATSLANAVGATAKSYTDSTDATTLTSAKSYTDTKAGTLKDASNVQYADATSLANAVGATAKSYTDSTDTATLTSAKSYSDTSVGNLQVTTPNGASIVTPPVGGSTTTYTSTTTALQSLQNQIGKLNGSGFNDMRSYVDGTFTTTSTLNTKLGTLKDGNNATQADVTSLANSDLAIAKAYTDSQISSSTQPPVSMQPISSTFSDTTANTSFVDMHGVDGSSFMSITTPVLTGSRKVLVLANIQVTCGSGCIQSSKDDIFKIQLLQDGSPVGGEILQTMTPAQGGTATGVIVPLSFATTTLSAGVTHTFKIQWAFVSGDSTSITTTQRTMSVAVF